MHPSTTPRGARSGRSSAGSSPRGSAERTVARSPVTRTASFASTARRASHRAPSTKTTMRATAEPDEGWWRGPAAEAPGPAAPLPGRGGGPPPAPRRTFAGPAAVSRLRRSRPYGPGIYRKVQGRGFRYVDETGRAVGDDGTLERISSLAIPPAWTDV